MLYTINEREVTAAEFFEYADLVHIPRHILQVNYWECISWINIETNSYKQSPADIAETSRLMKVEDTRRYYKRASEQARYHSIQSAPLFLDFMLHQSIENIKSGRYYDSFHYLADCTYDLCCLLDRKF